MKEIDRALSKEQELTVPKELRKVRIDSTVDWEPKVLEDWMAEQGDVSIQWVSETIGKNKFYLYKCVQRKRIGKEALIRLQDLTGIPKSFFMGNAPLPKDEEEQKPVRVYTAPVEEFGMETEKRPEPVINQPEPKRTLPKGWIAVSGIDFYQFIRVEDIVQVKQCMNGARVITNHGTMDVIDNAHTIMERMAEC